MDATKAQQILRDKYIGKWAKVVTKNNRIFEGKIMCVDYKANLILHEAIEQIPEYHNCPLNYNLYNYSDSKLTYEPPKDLPQEERMKMIKEYLGTHYFFGSIMVAGNDIAKLELSTLPEKNKQKQSQSKEAQKAPENDKK